MSGRGSILRLINCFVLSEAELSCCLQPEHQVRTDKNIMMSDHFK